MNDRFGDSPTHPLTPVSTAPLPVVDESSGPRHRRPRDWARTARRTTLTLVVVALLVAGVAVARSSTQAGVSGSQWAAQPAPSGAAREPVPAATTHRTQTPQADRARPRPAPALPVPTRRRATPSPAPRTDKPTTAPAAPSPKPTRAKPSKSPQPDDPDPSPAPSRTCKPKPGGGGK